MEIQERTFQFGVAIVKYVDALPDSASGRHIGKQLLRAATSIGANMAEADSAESRRDFVHKVGIALKEAQEARYWLRLLGATLRIGDPMTAAHLGEADELVKVLYTIQKKSRQVVAVAGV